MQEAQSDFSSVTAGAHGRPQLTLCVVNALASLRSSAQQPSNSDPAPQAGSTCAAGAWAVPAGPGWQLISPLFFPPLLVWSFSKRGSLDFLHSQLLRGSKDGGFHPTTGPVECIGGLKTYAHECGCTLHLWMQRPNSLPPRDCLPWLLSYPCLANSFPILEELNRNLIYLFKFFHVDWFWHLTEMCIFLQNKRKGWILLANFGSHKVDGKNENTHVQKTILNFHLGHWQKMS